MNNRTQASVATPREGESEQLPSVWLDALANRDSVIELNRSTEIQLSWSDDHFEAFSPELGIRSFGLTSVEAIEGVGEIALACLRRYSEASDLTPLAQEQLAKIERLIAS